MSPLTHSFPTTKLKKSGLSHQHRLHVFEYTNRDCFPFRFYFNTNECIYTHRGKIQERPELPPPYDPPETPFRRVSYYFVYTLSHAILLFSTSFEISVIITHFLVTPYSFCWLVLSKNKSIFFLFQSRNVYIIYPKHNFY